MYIFSLTQQGNLVFEAEQECGLRLSDTGETKMIQERETLHFLFLFINFFTFYVSIVPSGRSEWQRSLLPDFSHSSWAIDSKLAAELCSRWQNHKDKLPCWSVCRHVSQYQFLHNNSSTEMSGVM